MRSELARQSSGLANDQYRRRLNFQAARFGSQRVERRRDDALSGRGGPLDQRGRLIARATVDQQSVDDFLEVFHRH